MHLHVLNPGPEIIFHRAVMFSGSAASSYAYNDNPNQTDLLFQYGKSFL